MNIKNLKEKFLTELKLILTQIKEIFNKKNIILLISIIIIGLIVHFELIARDVSNPDTILSGYNYTANGWEVSLGRWCHVIISKLRFGLSTPVYSTVISLLIIGIASLFLIDLLNIKSTVGKIFTSLLLITIPSFTVTLTYFYCSDIYQIAMLCAVLVPWCVYKIKNRKIGILFGSIFLAISMGCYQSYLGVSLGLFVIVWILKLLQDNYNLKNLFKDILFAAVSIIIGLVFYAIVSKVFLILYNMNVATYSGASDISILNTIKNLPNRIIQCYKTFFETFFGNNIIKNSGYHRQILYSVSFIMIFVVLFFNFIHSKQKKNIIISIFLTLLLPIACNIILLIATERSMNALMSTAMFLCFIYLIALLEFCKINWQYILSYILIALISYTYILTANATYVSIDLTKEQTLQTAQNILQSIQSLDNYNTDTQICIVGIIDSENFPREDNVYNLAIGMVSDFNYFWADSYEIEKSGWQKIYETYLGQTVNLCDEETYNSIIETIEFNEMNIYPNSNSISIINNVIVVKLTNEPI